MKVIDLLNKIANGEAPKKIIFNKIEYELCEEDMLYYNKDNVILEEYCNITQELDTEIEIIEEPKKIEKIERDEDTTIDWQIGELYEMCHNIIDYINDKERNESK